MVHRIKKGTNDNQKQKTKKETLGGLYVYLLT